ncbi:MAG: membrane protein insertase YidC [Chlamydiae bacterium]|nr:membrane protein insertase YidC [Chlamydiota bacterium]MBI3276416.1 membrane protein insertase YidC [Chlamydiota bacterium]
MLGRENEDPNVGKRMILTVLISLGLLYGYTYFMHKYFPPPPTPQNQTSSVPNSSNVQNPSKEKAELAHPQSSQSLETWPEEKEITLETPLVKVTFSTLRASIKSLLLKESSFIRGDSVSLVQFQNPNVQPGAISRTSDFPTKSFLSYTLTEQGPNFVVFEAHSKKIKILKKFTLLENYGINLEIQFSNTRKKTYRFYRGYDLSIGSMKVSKKSAQNGSELDPLEVDYFLAGGNGAYLKKSIGKIKEHAVEDLEISWAGMKSKYFALVIKPIEGALASALITDVVEENFERYYTSGLRMGNLVLEPGETKKSSFFIFCGPKNYDLLKSFNDQLEAILDFNGIWGSLSQGLVIALHGINRLFRNYGLAIIILTLLLKLVFYPLSAISLKSMKEMQALKPQLDIIKTKYKSNPKKIQQETMALYKEHHIRPLAGCLPMLVQVPIFIAFYRVLMSSIELRGAHFLWINDLAKPDALFHVGTFSFNILPILNGLTMYWQQATTPTDPSQKSMKYIMPVMLTFLFYNLPSGLILYWFVTTLITALQQYQMKVKKPISSPPLALSKH